MEWFQVVLVFLDEYSAELSAATVLGGGAFGFAKWFRKDKGTDLSEETIKQIKPTTPVETAALTVPQFIAIRREMKADLEQELSQTLGNEKAELQSRIAELEAQISDPEPALAEAQEQIADLTERLNRLGNDIGGDRLAEAQAALKKLDYSVADGIFAEIEDRQKLEVEKAARAAFGRGEIAEAEIRWHDAADHYARAARLDPNFETLRKAREFAWRAGAYDRAFQLGEDLIAVAKNADNDVQIATALNNHALCLDALGRYSEAEAQFREALAICETTIGVEHPNYAIRLNNLANVVQVQGRYAEAETLYREALAIGETTIGVEHPNYAIRLNNLANVVQVQGRYAEAEGLYRDALAIDEKTIGVEHPDYAIDLNNLANVVKAQGRYAEAEGLFRDALAIGEKTIGVEHPDYAKHLNNLAMVVEAQGRYAEAEDLYRAALAIALKRLGAEHPNTQRIQANLDRLLAKSL